MDIIESVKRDKAYVKCKALVKNWERDFKEKFSRTPSKYDIKEAPANIKYAYKKYFHLKSVALENSLSICDDEEYTVLTPEPMHQLESPPNVFNTQELLPPLPSGPELVNLLGRSEKNNDSVSKNIITDNLSKKLFKNTKFSLRNPRKSGLSKEKSTLNQEIAKTDDVSKLTHDEPNDSENISIINSLPVTVTSDMKIPNNEHIFDDNKSVSNHVPSTLPSCSMFNSLRENLTNAPVRQIDINWLERATGLTYSNEELDSKPKEEFKQFGIRNVKLPDSESFSEVVENSESDDDDIVLSKLKPALKKRKLDHHLSQPSKTEYENSVNKNNLVLVENNQEKGRRTKNKKISNISNETNDLRPPDIREFLPFGLKEEVVPRHSNISNIIEVSDKNTLKIDLSQHNKEENKLIKKFQNGTINENFVKINIEKKKFVRGKKTMNFSKYKKKLWKDKKSLHGGMEFPESGKISCFKCGLEGHMARYCKAHKENSLLPLDNYDESCLPTLKDMENVVNKETNIPLTEESISKIVYEASEIPDNVLKLLAETTETYNKVNPVLTDCEESSEELNVALNKFGHSSFRSGQEEAIKRILCGKSTLLVLSTGSGKSLCYQLPAFIYSQHYQCVTLVISPLVSLMEDQVLNMPEFLKAGCLHTNQQPTQRRKIIECLKNGDISILLISPEALIAGDTSNGFAGLFKSLPPIAFACIDEAHCVSQWSHNFRPSYLMICRVLREKLNVKCILGLTATASQTTIRSIIDHLNIPDGINGVLTNPALPNNLYLSMSFEKDKDRALVSLLETEKINAFSSIIVYCIRRNECERVASVIRSCLSQPNKISMENGNRKRKRMSYIAEAYHAGMSAAQRKKIQKHFMDGTLKIIVATVAFGMGINKSDIRCIIHYNMPPSFESYVQEVGRAGRDGQSAFCHVFMNNSTSDKDELLKHIHANSVDRPVIRKFLQKVFIPCKCVNNDLTYSSLTSTCKGHEVGIPIDSTVEELDIPSENIATLLCYIELHHKHYIKVLNNAYTICKISSYGGPVKILEAAKTCPPLAMAYLLMSKRNSEATKSSVLEFNVIEVAAAIGWESGMTKYHLKNLEWITSDGTTQRSHLKVEFNTLAFRIRAPGDLSGVELDSMLDDLHENVLTQEKMMLCQLEEIYKSFSQICYKTGELVNFTEEVIEEKSNKLKCLINNYFMRKNILSEDIVLSKRPLDVERVIADARALIATYKDCKFTGRSIARIFQGISSPNYPALVWGKCKFWRTHLSEDFNGIVKIATQQIIQMSL